MRSACYSRHSPAIEGREKTIMGGRICPASPVGQADSEAGLQPVSFLLTESDGRRRCPSMAEENLVLRWPSLRRPLDVLFLVTSLALTVYVLVPEIWGNGKTKDYPLWFWAGQQVLQGKDLYPADANAYFELSIRLCPRSCSPFPIGSGKFRFMCACRFSMPRHGG